VGEVAFLGDEFVFFFSFFCLETEKTLMEKDDFGMAVFGIAEVHGREECQLVKSTVPLLHTVLQIYNAINIFLFH